ncbi:MAG: SGNH/GDSL hydrolase family protein [Oscillospiraceae bacterium]
MEASVMSNLFADALGIKEYETAVARCVIHGAASRLSRALSGDSIRIGFLGGSVTYGYQSDGSTLANPYPALLCERLRALFPDKKIEGCNLGFSGTNCLMGAIAAEAALRAFSPDIVFVEYAVNEETSRSGIARFESLIRKLLRFNGAPAVVPVALFLKSGYSCEEYMLAVSAQYGLDFCAFQTAFACHLECGAPDWAAYADDGVHPSPAGHTAIADCLFSLIKSAKSAPEQALASPLFSDQYEDMKLISLMPDTDSGFVRSGESCYCFHELLETLPCGAEKVLCFSVCSSCCAVVYRLSNNSETAAEARVFLDGRYVCTLDSFSVFGWGNPAVRMIFDEKTAAPHSIELRVSGGNKRFVLAAVGADG